MSADNLKERVMQRSEGTVIEETKISLHLAWSRENVEKGRGNQDTQTPCGPI